jgi:hypothetical protein
MDDVLLNAVFTAGSGSGLINKLRKGFPALCQHHPSSYSIPPAFPLCSPHPTLAGAPKHIFVAFDVQRSVLLVGQEGCGVTQVSPWAADDCSRQHGVERGSTSSFCFICTPETTITYWIGRFIPVTKAAAGGELIVWQHGRLIKAVVAGHCGAIDCIDAAVGKHPRVNCPLHFRLIASSRDEGLNSFLPALLNRFNVV